MGIKVTFQNHHAFYAIISNLFIFPRDFRKVAELQASLSSSTQKIGKLSESIEQQKVESEREVEVLVSKHEEDLKSFQQRLDDAVSGLH